MLNKLIVVGMRYMKGENIRTVSAEFKALGSLPVQLKIEDNSEGLNGKALAVWSGDRKLGYIRNKDLSSIMSDFGKYNYKVIQMNTNYWIINSEAKSYTTNPYTTNPCNEIPLPDSVKTSRERAEEYAKAAASEIWATREASVLFPPNAKVTVNTTKENKMNVSSNMRDSFFREVKNVAIDIQSGKFGVLSNDGISVYAEGGVSVNPIAELGVKIPAFAMRVPVKDLKEGDIVINGSESSFFKGLTENGYEVVTLNGEVKQVGSVSNMFFGKNSVLAVKNMFGEGTNPMMMALLMGDGGFGDGDNKKLMLAMAMSGGFGGDAGGINPLMMMLMLGK